MLKTTKNLKLKGKKVLLRVDFNCSIKDGKILDDFRIKKEIPFLKSLLKERAKVILISHLGRPDGKKEPKLSLKSVKRRLEKYLKKKVLGPLDLDDKNTKNLIENIKEGDLAILENIRFYPGELKGEENFAKTLSLFGDIFINDAFSVSHRNHSSVVKITKFLKSFAGPNLISEIKNLSKILKKPKRPLVAIIGGTKIEDKVPLAEKFCQIADFVLVGNLVGFWLQKRKIENFQKIIFPVDKKLSFDLNNETIRLFKEKIKIAQTIFWAGPLGKIEQKKYQKGTMEIAKAILKSKSFSVVGGGDTIEFLNKFSFVKKFDFVSMGGGAMLKFLAGEKLPGIEVLKVCQR